MTTLITLSFFNALIIGVIFAHLALTTPAIFRALDPDSASKSLRTIFLDIIFY